MSRINAKADCWPTWQQELLLRAALLQGDNSIAAWERWKSTVDVEHLDIGSHRLLPHLYRNLQTQGVTDPLMGRFKGVYRRTWYDNQLLFHHVSTLLSSFHDAGIETIVLKGAALALLHYMDCGLRPMNDFDVMIPVNQTSKAIALMRELGWNPIPRSPEALTDSYLSIVNSHGFVHSAGRECDLHWHLFPECCQADADNEFWEQSVPFKIHGVAPRSLAPTDQLLHVCVHGAEWNPIPPLRWVADAMMIMKTAKIDWDRLISQARKRQMMLPVKGALDYLHRALGAQVPAQILQRIHNIPASKMELAEYKYKIQNYESRPLGFLPLLWFRYLRLEGKDSSHMKLIGFMKYLQRFWGVDHIRQLPSYAAFMATRRIRLISTSVIQSMFTATAIKTGIQAHGKGRDIGTAR